MKIFDKEIPDADIEKFFNEVAVPKLRAGNDPEAAQYLDKEFCQLSVEQQQEIAFLYLVQKDKPGTGLNVPGFGAVH